MLIGIFAGAIADNFDRRRVMPAAQTGMLIVSALLALTTWMGAMNPLLLLCFTLAVGCGTALNAPAWQASVRLQVGHEHLPQARSDEHTSELQSLMRHSYAVFSLQQKTHNNN